MTSSVSFEALSVGIAAASPEDRLGVFYRALQEAPQYVFWPLLFEWLPRFESIGRIRRKLLKLLRTKGTAWPFVSAEGKALYDLQMQEVQVFRGCSPNNRAGLCWCLDYDRSDWYARLAKVNNEVGNVYEARIPRRAIFAITGVAQGDTTVILDCDALHDIQLLKFRPTLGSDGHLEQWRAADRQARSALLRPRKTDYDILFPLAPSLPKLRALPSEQVEAFRNQHARRLKWEPFRQIVEWLERAVEAANEELEWRREHPNHNPKTHRPNWVEEAKGKKRADRSLAGPPEMPRVEKRGRPRNVSRRVALSGGAVWTKKRAA